LTALAQIAKVSFVFDPVKMTETHTAGSNIELRECTTVDELSQCVDLQRAVFALPEVEISPVRHFIVTKNAGGFTLGAFAGGDLIGFVLSVPAFLRGERAFYSHMTAVRRDFQGSGIGARLKWAQRERALDHDVRHIKWTFEPVKARNAYFNLEKLGAVVVEYQENFYGIDYATDPRIGLASDRLFAEWHLVSEKVQALAQDGQYSESRELRSRIRIPADWERLVAETPEEALAEQLRIRGEFDMAFSASLVCRGFERRDAEQPSYLLYDS
jgi:predicted GNAT superfamily acetyltransferase